MVTSSATASSRASTPDRPALLEPSPEISITRHSPLNGLWPNRPMEWSIAPEIDLPPPNNLGVDSICEAADSMDASFLRSIHGNTGACRNGPVHWNRLTAIDCAG